MKLSSALAIATPILVMLGVITAVACGSDRPPVSDPGVRSPGGVQTGPCSTNGETVACDVETGRSSNRSCTRCRSARAGRPGTPVR